MWKLLAEIVIVTLRISNEQEPQDDLLKLDQFYIFAICIYSGRKSTNYCTVVEYH
jgi:hypothetical protein